MEVVVLGGLIQWKLKDLVRFDWVLGLFLRFIFVEVCLFFICLCGDYESLMEF